MLDNSLIVKYEGGGDLATVSTGSGDLGGRSYGIYQFSSASGVVDSFINWLCNYPEDCYANYGRVLKNAYPINSDEFISTWKNIGTVDKDGFAKLQTEYAGDMYYNAAYYNLLYKDYPYDIARHSNAMQAVLFSRSIQYGPNNMYELFSEAAHRLGYPNLTYVDDKSFDRKMIESIYDFLADECRNAYQLSNGLYHSPKDWSNGSYTVVKVGLLNRFINEKADALALLEKEGL